MPDIFAFTRSELIKTPARLRDLTRHAKREDHEAKHNLRAGAYAGAGLDWPDRAARDVVSMFKEHKARTGASERKGAPLLVHMLVGVSPQWVEEKGDLHDHTNVRNIQLFETSIGWAQTAFGEGSVIAARMDLDEEGGAVVDLFICPVRQQKYKNRLETRAFISTNKAMEELAIRNDLPRGNHFSAAQTSWANYAAAHLDRRIKRGTPKDISGRNHVHSREYKLDKREASLNDKEAELALREKEQAQSATAISSELATIEGILTHRDLYELRPSASGKGWNVPQSILVNWRRLDLFNDAVAKILQKIAATVQQLRDELRRAQERERELSELLNVLTPVAASLEEQDRMRLMDAQEALRSSTTESPFQLPSYEDGPEGPF